MNIFSMVQVMRENPYTKAETVGRIVTINDLPTHVCKTEVAASLLALLLNAAQKADISGLLRISSIVINIERSDNNTFSIFSAKG